jgi:hypothetical protein
MSFPISSTVPVNGNLLPTSFVVLLFESNIMGEVKRITWNRQLFERAVVLTIITYEEFECDEHGSDGGRRPIRATKSKQVAPPLIIITMSG